MIQPAGPKQSAICSSPCSWIPEARLRCPDREGFASQYMGMLRTAVAGDPTHPRATEMVGVLSIRSADFRRLWARYDVREAVHGTKPFRHQEVGDLTLTWDTCPLPGSPGPVLLVYTTAPGSADAERVQLLATLQATRHQHKSKIEDFSPRARDGDVPRKSQ